MNATRKRQTNPAAAKRLIATKNNSCDAISGYGERNRGRGGRAIRRCGQRISVIVENIGCSEYAARDVCREVKHRFHVQTVGGAAKGYLRQNANLISAGSLLHGNRSE